MGPTIRCVDEGAVRTITLVNPAKRNALTVEMLDRLSKSFPSSPSSPSQPIRAVIVVGEGGTFSSGFDLQAVADERDDGVDPIRGASHAIAMSPVPVIAAVDGACYGGAVEILASCALRVASAAARFAVPAVQLGLVYPASGLRRFRRVMGSNAERVLLTGRAFSADDARAWGLVHDVVDDARAFARSLADDLVRSAPLAVAGTLGALRGIDAGVDDDVLEDIREIALRSDDLVEGIRAANEKRPARFAGR